MKTIIRNARVLTFGEDHSEHARANILVDPPNIVAVGPEATFGSQPTDPTDARAIDADGLLAIPGLINGHFHSPANLLKGTLPGMPLEVFMLYEVPPLREHAPSARSVYACTQLGAVEMLKRGVTALQDDAYFVPRPSPEAIDALARAYADVGMRATIALDQPNVVEYEKYPYLEEILPPELRREMQAAPRPSTSELLELYAHLIDEWHGARAGRIRAAVSCSAPQRVTADYLDGLAALSREHGLPFFMHMLETRLQRVLGDVRYGKSLVRHVDELGYLDRRVNLIHGIWIDDADMDLIAERGCTIAHNPVCNLRLGSGIMPFRRIRECGIDVCLGSDEMLADDSANLWAVAKLVGLVHTLSDPDYRRWPNAAEVLDCLFRGGARAMGLEGRVGCIAPGHAADLVLLDLDTLAFTPLNDLHRQLVYCEDGSSVRLTMVAGEVVVEDGRVLTCDEAALRREVRDIVGTEAAETTRAVAAAQRLEPYYREMYLRAAHTEVGMERGANGADTT